jgi:hypothetical protein
MTHFRLRYEKRGSHVHARMFSAPREDLTHGKNGDLCFTAEEWNAFLFLLSTYGSDTVEFVPEGDPSGH